MSIISQSITEIFNIHSAGAGEGKTTTWVIPMLIQNVKDHKRTLLVVPSMDLQSQINKDLVAQEPKLSGSTYFKLINCDTKDNTSVVKSIYAAINGKTRIICITHEAFKRLDLENFNFSDFHLVMDEALSPSNTIEYKNYNVENPINRMANAKILQRKGEFNQVEFSGVLDSIDCESSTIRTLYGTDQYTFWVNDESYKKLSGEKKGTAYIIQELKIETLTRFASVGIAAAAFEHTEMHHWVKANGIELNYIQPFTVRQLPIVLNIAKVDGKSSISKSMIDKDPLIMMSFRQYVKDNVNGEFLSCWNNSQDISPFQNEIKIKHNSAGSNEYRNITSISLASSINPPNEYSKWMIQRYDITHDQVIISFSTYMQYQQIMRTKARMQGNTDIVNVYSLAPQSALLLDQFIDPYHSETFQIAVSPPKPRKTRSDKKSPEEKRAATAKRQQLYKLNQKLAKGK